MAQPALQRRDKGRQGDNYIATNDNRDLVPTQYLGKLEDVLLPVDDGERAVGVPLPDVTGAKEAVGRENLGGDDEVLVGMVAIMRCWLTQC
jgi:hypothetical protein